MIWEIIQSETTHLRDIPLKMKLVRRNFPLIVNVSLENNHNPDPFVSWGPGSDARGWGMGLSGKTELQFCLWAASIGHRQGGWACEMSEKQHERSGLSRKTFTDLHLPSQRWKIHLHKSSHQRRERASHQFHPCATIFKSRQFCSNMMNKQSLRPISQQVPPPMASHCSGVFSEGYSISLAANL
jgi:hypothetical protein